MPTLRDSAAVAARPRRGLAASDNFAVPMVRCPRCRESARLETFGVWVCERCGRVDADANTIVEVAAPPIGSFAPPPDPGAPLTAPIVGAPAGGVSPNVVGALLSIALVAWIGAHVYANTCDGVLDREELVFIMARTLFLPVVAFGYRAQKTMGASGWFVAVILMGGMLASALPGVRDWAGRVMLFSMIGFLNRKKKS